MLQRFVLRYYKSFLNGDFIISACLVVLSHSLKIFHITSMSF